MRVYFDYNATTPPAPEVTEAVVRVTRDTFGNASSVHHFGQQAKAAIDEARSAVASLINADPSELVFTGGGTEADNFAVRGAADALEATGRKQIIASAIEHEAVLNTLRALARRGWRATLLPVDESGIVAPDRLREAITADTAIVSVMHANSTDSRRRQARTESPGRHRERAGDCRPGRRRAAGGGKAGRSGRAGRRAARPARRGDPAGRTGNGGERRAHVPCAEHHEYQFRSRRSREPAHCARPRWRGRFDRVRVLVGIARAVTRAARDGTAGAPDAELAAIQSGTVLDRRGSGSRGGDSAAAGGQASIADTEAAGGRRRLVRNDRDNHRGHGGRGGKILFPR